MTCPDSHIRNKLCAWAGLTPRLRESDIKTHLGSITKQGSPPERWSAIEAVSRYHGGALIRDTVLCHELCAYNVHHPERYGAPTHALDPACGSGERRVGARWGRAPNARPRGAAGRAPDRERGRADIEYMAECAFLHGIW